MSAALRIRGLAAPTSSLPGVGPARAQRLERLGVRSVRDLLFLMPRRIERWPAPVSVADACAAAHGTRLVVKGEVRTWSFARFGRRSLVRVKLADASGEIDVLFFNQAWLQKRFQRGVTLELVARRVAAPGKGKGPALACLRLGGREPLPAPGSLESTYPAADGLGQAFLRDLVRTAALRHADELDEPLPAAELAALDLPQLSAAVREVHAPTDEAAFARAGRRVALETLLELQAQLAARRGEHARRRAQPVELDDAERTRVLARLPFTLTPGQAGVVDELGADLARPLPMRRLLQGDVGSGKTLLGLFACMAVAERGGQSAFMAPTELLAEQHFAGARALLERAGLRAVLLTGALPAAERRAALAELAAGTAHVAFGTHALFSPAVRFARLWLAVIDEQHRFGVEQRRALVGKGEETHLLLMTATPIPRSLALTVYGDLDVSLLRDKPPGRAPIATAWRGPQPRLEDASELAQRLEGGERAYWVVPRIETPEADDEDEDPEVAGALGAEERCERLRKTSLAAHGVELVHGRVPAAERARRIERFRSGAARLLVATTVIEVGVDVPEASVIVIEGAERLGLAQLHQLRGRVGRGARPSRCWLFGSPVARERLELLERCDDGFTIAEADLLQRGMGDLTGLRQAGASAIGLLDRDLLEAARRLLQQDPALARAYARPLTRSNGGTRD